MDDLIGHHHEVPATLTHFYGGYVTFLMERDAVSWQQETRRSQRSASVSSLEEVVIDPTAVFAKFGQVAFDVIVRKRKLSRDVLEKQYQISLPSSPSPSVEELHGEANGIPQGVPGTFGCLLKDETSKKGHLVFRDVATRDYLAAQYQLAEVKRKINSSRKKLLSSALVESVRRLPVTGDLWRITLGLMIKTPETRRKQRALMVEILDHTKTLITMGSYDMTSLCVEAIYESRNTGGMSKKMLDDFTLNQTINFSNVKVAPHRLNYSVAAVGHLVRTSGEVFGLHLSKFGITEENIHLLADPLNVISDNSLQVLVLSNNELGEGGIMRLERFLVKASLLTHLDLSNCKLYDAGAIILAEVMVCLQLIYLNLSENGITDVGMVDIIKSLRFCPSLEFLILFGNRLSDKSAVRLGESIQWLPSMRSLDLRRNAIGEDGVKSVTKNVKHLRPAPEKTFKKRSLRSISVWKTRSARLSNFSLKRVPMGGVLKRNSQIPEETEQSHNSDNSTRSLPNLAEEEGDSHTEADVATEAEVGPAEGKRQRVRMARMQHLTRGPAKRRGSTGDVVAQ